MTGMKRATPTSIVSVGARVTKSYDGDVLTRCRPEEVPVLLGGVLAGQTVLAPIGDEATAAALDRVDEEPPIDSGVVVGTSGSTGQPKLVVLSSEALIAAADGFRTQYGSFTWHCALPMHYVAGIMALVRGHLDDLHGGGFRIASPDLSNLEPAPGRNALCVVPTQLRRGLADPALCKVLTAFDMVIAGGASCPPWMLENARQAGVQVVTSYGMSETCGGVAYSGEPLPGVDIDIVDGRITIATPALATGYLGAPDLAARTFVDGRLITNDRGAWVCGPKGKRLQVLGRLDDVVISGGVNVDLGEVQRLLDGIGPGLAVVAVPDAEWGQRVVLAAPNGTLAEWRDRLRPHLGAPALPRQLLLGALPLTGSGKINRRALVERAATREGMTSDHLAG